MASVQSNWYMTEVKICLVAFILLEFIEGARLARKTRFGRLLSETQTRVINDNLVFSQQKGVTCHLKKIPV